MLYRKHQPDVFSIQTVVCHVVGSKVEVHPAFDTAFHKMVNSISAYKRKERDVAPW